MDDKLCLNNGIKKVKIITKKGSLLEIEDIDSIEIYLGFDEENIDSIEVILDKEEKDQ